MNERDLEQAQDNQEVEITDLDETSKASRPKQLILQFAAFPLDRRYRRPLTFATGVMLLLAIVGIVANTSPLRSLWPVSAIAPSAQQEQPGTYTYIVQANPPWGRLFVDGHLAHFSPQQGSSPILLSRGRHTLTWRANPFVAQQCIIDVPPGTGLDTCKHLHLQLSSNGSTSTNAIIEFQTSLDLLRPGARDALIQAAQKALDLHQSSATVQPGEIYAISSLSFSPAGRPCLLAQNATLCYLPAKQPLQATVSFGLDTDTSPSGPCTGGACIYNGEDCRLFCDATVYDTPIASLSPSRWNAFAIVHIIWKYHTVQGQPVGPAEADTFVWGQQDEYLVPLSIAWDGASWSVATQFDNVQAPLDNPMCVSAIADVSTLLYADARTGFSFESVPAPTFALGCLIKVQLLGGPGSGPVPSAYLLHRFGVLLAINDEARRLLPFLPLADRYEAELAKELGANAG